MDLNIPIFYGLPQFKKSLKPQKSPLPFTVVRIFKM